jgi:hypothetical protein
MTTPEYRALCQTNVARRAVLIATLGGALTGCEPMDRSELLAIDCDAESTIERDLTPADGFPFEVAADNDNFFCFADSTIDGYPGNSTAFPGNGCPKPLIEPIENGGFCQSGADATLRHTGALVIRAGQHDFYGGEIANWNWNSASAPAEVRDDTGEMRRFVPEGIAFWARSDIQSDKFITIYLGNSQTTAPSDTVPGTTYSPTLALKNKEAGCVPLAASGTGPAGVSAQVGSTDPNVQTSTSSISVVSGPNQCGNRWRRLLQTSEAWKLYLLPFDTFYQDVQPNRVVGPLDPTAFYQISFGFSRAQSVSLWIDEFFFYRKKPAPAAD